MYHAVRCTNIILISAVSLLTSLYFSICAVVFLIIFNSVLNTHVHANPHIFCQRNSVSFSLNCFLGRGSWHGPTILKRQKGDPLIKNIDIVKSVKGDPLAQNCIFKKDLKRLLITFYKSL